MYKRQRPFHILMQIHLLIRNIKVGEEFSNFGQDVRLSYYSDCCQQRSNRMFVISQADLFRLWRRCATAKQSSSAHRVHPAEHEFVENKFAIRHGCRISPVAFLTPRLGGVIRKTYIRNRRENSSPSLMFHKYNCTGMRI